MREIKFRAWDGVDLYLMDDEHEIYYKFNSGILKTPGIIIEQYTGLKDKNGKEIYEGDVVFTCYNELTIIFKDGCFGYIFFGDFHSLLNFNTSDLEIIGNIREEKSC